MSAYLVYVAPAATKDLKNLPARFRGRTKRAIDALAKEPRPEQEQKLDYSKLDCEPRRLRLEGWRILYAIIEHEKRVDVLALRKRRPYKYEDLEKLLENYSPSD